MTIREPSALVLVIEERICRCGAKWSAPAPSLFVELSAPFTATRQRVYERLSEEHNVEGLERKHLILSSRASACASCFRELPATRPHVPHPRNIPRQFRGDLEISGSVPRVSDKPQKPQWSLDDL